MSSTRIYDLARKLNVPSRELITMLKKRGIEVKSHMSTVDDSTAGLILEAFEEKGKSSTPKTSEKAPKEEKVGIRTYIPPRQRRRKRVDTAEKIEKPKQPLERGREDKTDRREKPSHAEKRKKRPPYRGVERQRVTAEDRRQRATDEVHGADIPKKREISPQPKAAARAQAKKPQKKDVKKRQDSQISEGTGRRVRSETREQKPTPGSVQQRKIPSRPVAEIQEKRKQRVAAAVSQRSEKTQTKRPEQENRQERELTQKRSAVFQKRPVIAPHQAKKPHKKSVAKTPTAAQVRAKTPEPPVQVEELPKRLEIPEMIMVKELAEKMNVPPAKVVRHLMTMGIMANVNQVLETKAAMSIAEEFGFEVKAVSADDETHLQAEIIDESKLKPRSPVVTIMGHVDHGKTTLLDAIQESKITDSEFGGITQHIGAYRVDINGQKIVFLDTPGHEAFTAMRARGAQVTDEVILVVAADDGIMPQTIEAIDHARAAHVPIIVAINKIDVPGANPDRVMQEMTKYGLTPEEWGGETICVKVSAKERINLDELLEMILLQAEILELKADPDRHAQGIIVEALLDKGRGPVATVLVQSGTLRVGDPFVVGVHHGKVRAMLDDRGKRVKETGPATPVEVLGLTGVPVAGDSFVVVENERRARHIAESHQEHQQTTEFAKTTKITLEELHHHIKEGEIQELRIIIKADVHGSVEALGDALERLSTEKVRLQVIHGGVGAINESDVMLAAASNAIVLGFNVRPVAKAKDMAEKEQIDVRLYMIIYQAIDDIKKAMEGLLEPTYKEVLVGQANVLVLFSLSKVGTVAGCRVTDGKITRNSLIRLLRDNKEIFKGNIASLRRVKDDVREVLTGYECGIRLENFNALEVGDIIEAYTLEKVAMTLEGTIAK